MRLVTPLTATAALLVFSAFGSAAQTGSHTSTATHASARPAAAAAGPAKKGDHMATITGTIEKFDPATGTLTLKEGNQEVNFVLASNATIREGSTTLAAADLGRAVGKRARVRYTGSGTTRTTEQVFVGGGPMAAKSSRPPSRH